MTDTEAELLRLQQHNAYNNDYTATLTAATTLMASVAPVVPTVMISPDDPLSQAVMLQPQLIDMHLPQALEQALAFKHERARQLGLHPEEINKIEHEGLHVEEIGLEPIQLTIFNLDQDEEKENKISKKKKGKEKKKKKKKKKKRMIFYKEPEITKKKDDDKKKDKDKPNVHIEYVPETLKLESMDPLFRCFGHVFDAFKAVEREPGDERRELQKDLPHSDMDYKKVPKMLEEEPLEERKEEDKPKLSKRKMKKLTRLTVAELKQLVQRPDVVEMHDITARDPRLLVLLKSTRNTVPVPRHWCFKRKYLQGKRGFEKPPFMLPDFIRRTGIMEMRQALQEKEDQKSMKVKMRERIRPKMGKIDIDYQKLHDAFFKWQTKPRMSIHGDLYYEGKEFETRLKEKKPGELSDELRIALGMPIGPSAHKVPPPWLIAMQRYGPPPSYPNLKIPGLNAPIPDSCSFGYHAGGWGKPPVDELGRPLYGDVFGVNSTESHVPTIDDDVDRNLWGELESESEESSEEEEEEEMEELQTEGLLDQTGLITPAEGGLVTPSGITSIPAGMETPEMIELRKRRIESEMEGGETPALYAVLPEKKTENIARTIMGSTHTYDIAQVKTMYRANEPQGIEVALDPSELDLMDTEAMAARYEQSVREQQNQLAKEDLSDMVAEHAAKQKSKRKRQQQQQQQQQDNKQIKKYKEFKF